MSAPLYKNCKGGVYVYLGTAKHTENGERLAVYRDSAGELHARPHDGPGGWNESVQWPDGTVQARFVRLPKTWSGTS